MTAKKGWYLYEKQGVATINAEAVPVVWLKLAKIVDPYLGGRYKEQGPCSGEEFREAVLLPLLAQPEAGIVTINLDGILGPTPSFFDEAFGGLVNALGPDVRARIRLEAEENTHLVAQVQAYMDEAADCYEEDGDFRAAARREAAERAAAERWNRTGSDEEEKP